MRASGIPFNVARYILRLKDAGAFPRMVLQPPLASLFRRSFDVPVLLPGEVVEGLEQAVPICLTAFPRDFDDTPATIPATIPYLFADPPRRQQWRPEIVKFPGCLRVGLCYAGDNRNIRDAYRSVPLRAFRPLADVPGVALFSLSIPPGSDQVQHAGFPVVDLGSRFDLEAGFEDVAACMEELDVIVAVDSAPAHLAGALGRPGFLLLSRTHRDPRRDLDPERTPWYPSLRLVRQGNAQD